MGNRVAPGRLLEAAQAGPAYHRYVCVQVAVNVTAWVRDGGGIATGAPAA